MLILYQAETCPYSSDVRRELTDLGLTFVAHNPRLPGKEGGDVKNRETYDQLTALADEDAIPFLVDTDDGRRIQGSEEIVDYLRENYS